VIARRRRFLDGRVPGGASRACEDALCSSHADRHVVV